MNLNCDIVTRRNLSLCFVHEYCVYLSLVQALSIIISHAVELYCVEMFSSHIVYDTSTKNTGTFYMYWGK